MLRLAMKDIPLVHEEIPLEILYEDEHLLALNKPPGVLTTPNHRYAVSLCHLPRLRCRQVYTTVAWLSLGLWDAY